MFCKIKGKCVFIGEPRKIQAPGREARVVREFGFLLENPKGMPEVVRVSSFNGFSPKMGEVSEFDARVSTRVWKDTAQLQIEVL